MLKSQKVIKILFLFIIILYSCKKENPVVPDTIPPQVQITNPSSGSVITTPINIKISATDNDGINKVSVILDGDTLAILSNAPYTVFWNVGYWADDQNHTIMAVAVDNSGNISQSDLVKVVVSTDAQISPNLISPTRNATFSENDEITFKWNSLIGAECYELEIANDTIFANPVINQTVTDTIYTDNSLTSGAYYWRVRSLNNNAQYSAWSDYFHFEKGNFRWSITLDRGLSDWGNFITETNDGGYVVVGPSYTDTTYMRQDIWLNKLDFNGDRIWGNTFGDPNADYGNWVEQTSDGGYYIFGGHSENSRQMWLIRTDAQGGKLWDKKYGDPDSSSWGIRGRISENDNLFVCGKFDNKSGVLYLDGSGNVIWKKQLDFDSTTTSVGSIDLCTDGSIVGVTRKNIFKINQSGNLLWYKEIQLTENGSLKRVIQTNDGGFVITAYEDGVIKTDAFGNELWRYNDGKSFYSVSDNRGTGFVATGTTANNNVFLMAFNYNNNVQWVKEYSSGIATAVTTTNDGGFILTGSTTKWGRIDSDIFIIKTDSEGNTEGKLPKSNFFNNMLRNINSLSNPYGELIK